MLIRAVLLLAALGAGAARADSLPLSACDAPVHSPEARRYELQGTTRLALSVGPDRKASNVSVAASSGSALLDAASVKLAASCRFAQPAAAATLDVPWVLGADAIAPQRPMLVPGSCGASALFKPVEAGAPNANMMVRLQVWADGQVYAPKFETGSGKDKTDKLALALVQACRYSPAQRDGVAVQSSAVLHLAFASDKLDDAALRVLYQRFLPQMQKNVAGKTEYHSAHILMAREADARAAHAKIVAGEAFAQVAKRSIDRGGKDGGDLGWALAEHYTKAYADALRGAAGPGLLPEPVKTEFGWHIIRIEAMRPAEPPTFDAVREQLWQVALAEAERPRDRAAPSSASQPAR